MRMVIIVLLCFGAVAFGETSPDQSSTSLVERDDMVVVGESMHSGSIVGQDASVAVTLDATPGIIVNNQGVPGGQADISIRGSSFSGAGISLSGLALNGAQTEHFNAELPIIAGVLSAPVVLSGFDQVLSTEGHLVGTASFEIMPINRLRSLTVGAAEDDGYWLNFLVQESLDLSDGSGAVGFGLFGSHTEINSVDYSDNDLVSSRGGGQIQLLQGDSQLDLIIAHQQKKFGARGYYGVTPDWYAEEELEDTLIVGSWLNGDADGSHIRGAIMRRELTDDYTLFWSYPGVYNNEHRTVTHSGVISGRHYWNNFVLDWRSNVENENIRSESLGNHERYRGSGMLLPGVQLGIWNLRAGVRYEVFEDEDSETLPQGAIEVAVTDGFGICLSYSESIRQPSYTELNYESPVSLGNSGLENQKSETVELLAKWDISQNIAGHLGVFNRITHDTVDWIRATSDSTRWTADNLGKADTDGVVCGLDFRGDAGNRISAHYSFLHKNSGKDFYSSRYAFDYPEHYVLLNGLWQISQCIGLELTQAFRKQEGNPLRTSSDSGYNGSLALHLVPRHNPQIQISLMVSNLWDDDYQYFPGQATVSPRRASLGLTVDW